MFNIRGVVLALLVSISISSCKSYSYEVSEDLIPYVDEYLDMLSDNDIKYKRQDFKIVFDDELLTTVYAGVAHGMFDSKRVKVSVHPTYWKMLSEKQKKILIFHELSHDLFDSRHTYSVFFMAPVMHSKYLAEVIDWDRNIKELIKYIKNER